MSYTTHFQRRILIVDDNVDAASAMATLLTMAGHAVHMVHDGLSAVSAAVRIQPEFVFLDIGLPGLDGYEVAARLRREPSLAGARIIAVTGHSSNADMERALNAGCDQYLIKPVDHAFLESLLGQSKVLTVNRPAPDEVRADIAELRQATNKFRKGHAATKKSRESKIRA